MPITANRETLKNDQPNIVVGTPGRMLALAREGSLRLDKAKHFVLDECDKMLEALGAFRALLRLLPLLLPVSRPSADRGRALVQTCAATCRRSSA